MIFIILLSYLVLPFLKITYNMNIKTIVAFFILLILNISRIYSHTYNVVSIQRDIKPGFKSMAVSSTGTVYTILILESEQSVRIKIQSDGNDLCNPQICNPIDMTINQDESKLFILCDNSSDKTDSILILNLVSCSVEPFINILSSSQETLYNIAVLNGNLFAASSLNNVYMVALNSLGNSIRLGDRDVTTPSISLSSSLVPFNDFVYYHYIESGFVRFHKLSVKSYPTATVTSLRLHPNDSSISNFVIDKDNTFYFIDQNRIKMIQNTLSRSSSSSNERNDHLEEAITIARFSSPSKIAVDDKGNLYVLDLGRISKIIVCSDDFVFNAVNNSCISCLPGSQLNQQNMRCEQCPPNTYKLSSTNANCFPCPQNSHCTSNGFLCHPGYELYNSSMCIKCPAGQFKSTLSNTTCKKCPIGTMSSSNGTMCDVCDINSYRPTVDIPECISCPEGAKCNGTHFICRPGYQLSSAGDLCSQCPKNYFKYDAGNYECGPCSSEMISNENYTECIPCPKNGYINPQGECFSCPDGAQCTADGFVCSRGFSLNQNGDGCSSCPDGYFKSSIGNQECNACPVDHQSSSDKITCQTCPDKFHRPNILVSKCTPIPEISKSAGSVINMSQTSKKPPVLPITSPFISNHSKSVNSNGELYQMSHSALIVIIVSQVAVFFMITAFCIHRYYSLNRKKNTDHSFSMIHANSSFSLKHGLPSSEAVPPATSSADSHSTSKLSWVSNQETIVENAGLCIPAFLLYKEDKDFVKGKKLTVGGSSVINMGVALNPELLVHGSQIIIKVFKIDQNNKQVFTEMFYQELAMMYLLRDHKNIAKIIGFAENPHSLILKFYKNGNLSKLIFSGKTSLTKRLQLRIISDIAKALQYIGSKGLAHCDLKTDNILLDVDASNNDRLIFVLTDFGLSRLVNNDSLTIKQFKVLRLQGLSHSYASPECISKFGIHPIHAFYKYEYQAFLSDIYSFAVILCEVLNRLKCWKQRN